MRAVLALIAVLVVCASADLTSDILSQVWAYEATQNMMNSTAAAALFTADAVGNIPLGQTQVVGKEIEAFFAGFFGAIQYLIEDILGEIVVIGQYASSSKLLRTAITPECPITLIANQYFVFDNSTSPPLISQFNVMWNVTSFGAQATCKNTIPLTAGQRRAVALSH